MLSIVEKRGTWSETVFEGALLILALGLDSLMPATVFTQRAHSQGSDCHQVTRLQGMIRFGYPVGIRFPYFVKL